MRWTCSKLLPMSGNKGGRPKGPHHLYIRDQGALDSSGRRACQCAFCDHEYAAMRPEQVWAHCLNECNQITQEVRDQARDHCAAKVTQPQAPQAKRKRSASAGQPASSSISASGPLPSVAGGQGSLARHTPASGNVTQQTQLELDSKCLRAFVHAGWSFNSIEDPYVVDWLQSLRPKWHVPGGS